MRSKVKKVAVTCMLATASLGTHHAWAQSGVEGSASKLARAGGVTVLESHQYAFIAPGCAASACHFATKTQITKSSEINNEIAEQARSPFAALAPRAHRR